MYMVFGVLLYFWDERHGPSLCGLRFGPKLGGDQVGAYRPSRAAQTPPKTGLKMSYDGLVDAAIVISSRALEQPQWQSEHEQQTRNV